MDFRRPIETTIPGAQGRVIAALLGTSGELNLRTIARVTGVSVAQASRVLPGLVELGMIERREVPPSSLFRLVPEHVATRALLELADSRGVVMTEMGRAASKIRPAPVSVIVFGSFARGDSDPDSDIDVVIVRPAGTDADDDRWVDTIDRWRTIVSRLAGNTVEILDVDADAVAAKLSGVTQLWHDIQRDGQVLFGERLDTLADGSMPGPKRTRPVSAAQIRAYAGKAEEFADAAASELEAGRFIAASSLAVHAGINAADAVCGARVGQRAVGEDHGQVLVLLGEAALDGAEVGRELRRLLPLKTTAEYEPDDVAQATATKAVERATRCAQIAQRAADSVT